MRCIHVAAAQRGQVGRPALPRVCLRWLHAAHRARPKHRQADSHRVRRLGLLAALPRGGAALLAALRAYTRTPAARPRCYPRAYLPRPRAAVALRSYLGTVRSAALRGLRAEHDGGASAPVRPLGSSCARHSPRGCAAHLSGKWLATRIPSARRRQLRGPAHSARSRAVANGHARQWHGKCRQRRCRRWHPTRAGECGHVAGGG